MAFVLHSIAVLAELTGAALFPLVRPRPVIELTDTIQGVRCQLRRKPVSKSNRVNISVSLPCDPRFELTLRAERSWDRVAKHLGLVRELQTNDPLFDQQIYVGCDERVIDDWLDQDEQARSIVVKLLRDAPAENTIVQSISCSRGLLTLSAQVRPLTLGRAPPDAAVRIANRCIGPLQMLGQRLAAYGADKTDVTAFRDPYVRVVRTFAALNMGFILLAITAMLALGLTAGVERGIDGRLLRLAAAVSVVALGLIAWAGFRWLWGSSRLHTVMAPLLLCAALGTATSSYTLLRELDRDFDHSVPQPHASRVLHRWTTHSKNSTTYHLRVRDWHDAQSTLELQVPPSVYRQFDLGDPVTVWERSGYLGVPWISGMARGDALAQRGD